MKPFVDPESLNYYRYAGLTTSLCIERILKVYPEKKPNELFKEVWDCLKFDMQLKNALEKISSGMFQLFSYNTYERLYGLIIITMINKGVGVRPTLITTTETKDLLNSIAISSEPNIVIGIHNGFAFGAAIFSNLNKKISVISSSNNILDTLIRSGANLRLIELINDDLKSLIKMKDLMNRGVLPVNCVDFVSNRGVYECINPNLFKFSLQTRSNLFFIRSEVTEDGYIKIEAIKHDSCGDSLADVHAFIDFHHRTSNIQRRYVIA